MSRIARLEAWPVRVPLEAPYEMAPGWVAGIHRTIVRVTSDDGVIGLGESASPADAGALRGELAAPVVGARPDELLETLGTRTRPLTRHRTDGRMVVEDPLAGVEIALWDLRAREAGVPLFDLLGSACRHEVAFSEYFAYRPGHEERPADVALYCARMAERHGSTVFEGKVAVRPPADDVRLVREIRAAVGPAAVIRLDANMGWRPDTARAVLARVEPFGIANVEEPVAGFEAMAEVRRSTSILFSAHAPDPELAGRLGAPDTLVTGLGAAGGIAGTRRLIAECERAGIGFWFYSGDLGIATAAYLHVAAATPFLDRPSQSLLRWTTDDVVAGGPFSPERGVLAVPTGPGLGVELDEEALARCVERFAREGPYDYYTGPPLPRH